jgi:hypothetical protein
MEVRLTACRRSSRVQGTLRASSRQDRHIHGMGVVDRPEVITGSSDRSWTYRIELDILQVAMPFRDGDLFGPG